MPPRWSEESEAGELATPADLAACREMLRQGSRTFFAASLLLPRHVCEPATALYAFCRLADDAVDLDGGGADVLAGLRERLARAYEGRPLGHAVDHALADVVARHAIPRALPEALLEGFEWDAEGRRYATLSQLCAYAARVAGAVGAMMAALMGVRAAGAAACACELGVAMQLTNIARDVGEDARAGRVYLPLDWLQEAGIDPEAWLADPAFSGDLGGVIKRLLQVAEGLYLRAEAGIAVLPASCRPGIYASAFLYAEIGREVERCGFDSVTRRAAVPARRKARLVALALAAAVRPGQGAFADPLHEVRFLVDALAGAPTPRASGPVASPPPWWKLEDQAVWALNLFERLERRRLVERSGGG